MSVRRLVQLGPEHVAAALRYCTDHPHLTTFAAGWLSDGGLRGAPNAPRAWMFADVDEQQAVRGLAYISDTGIVMPMLDPEAIPALAEMGRRNPQAVRVVVGQRNVVVDLWRRLSRFGFRARIERDQLGYTVERDNFVASPSTPLVLATVDHLAEVVEASAAMAREEAKDDPQSRNPALFEQRIKERITRGRDFVHTVDDHVVFKCNVSALSEIGGQIEGIYTLPANRRAGIGRACTCAITAWVLKNASRAFLLVNDDNVAAQKLYEALGYRRVIESRTVFAAP